MDSSTEQPSQSTSVLASWHQFTVICPKMKYCHNPTNYSNAPTEIFKNSLLFPCSLFNLDRPHHFVSFLVSHFSSFRARISYNTEADSAMEEVTGRMRSHEVIDEAPLEMSPRWKYKCICEQEVANKNVFSHCNYGKIFLNNSLLF